MNAKFSFRCIESVDKVNVGLISRIDYGRKGFKKGLLELAYKSFAEEKVDLVIVAGGLVSTPAIRGLFKEKVRAYIEVKKHYARVNDIKFKSNEVRKETESIVINEFVDELSKAIPRIKCNRRAVKTYIVISPSSNYDGIIGMRVARALAKKRRDVRVWGEGSADFPLKQISEFISVITPTKASWRSEYFSTMVDRMVKDEIKRRASSLPKIFVVGCSATAIMRQQGESRRGIVSIPAIHDLENISSSENAIGCRILKFDNESNNVDVVTYSFKDAVKNERRWISLRAFKKNSDEYLVFSAIKNGPMTIGMLADKTEISRKRILAAIKKINSVAVASKKIPDIVYNSNSGIYDFNTHWIQMELKHKMPNSEKLTKYSHVLFGCMHTGSVNTDYKFIRDDLPKIVCDWNADILVGAGDFIEGIVHNLILRGEVYGGMNITDQERIAASAVAHILLYVFNKRFDDFVSNDLPKSENEMKDVVKKSLMKFVYTIGNHDAWTERDGIRPLQEFKNSLIRLVLNGIETKLNEHNLHTYGIHSIVNEKVFLVPQESQMFNIRDGVLSCVIHPRMARTKTSSIRAQESLEKYRVAKIVDIANFHVAIVVEQWEEKTGNRIALQTGTLCRRTDFEDGKLKTVDFGVICSDIYFYKNRIVKTVVRFAGKPTNMLKLDNKKIVESVISFIEGKTEKI